MLKSILVRGFDQLELVSQSISLLGRSFFTAFSEAEDPSPGLDWWAVGKMDVMYIGITFLLDNSFNTTRFVAMLLENFLVLRGLSDHVALVFG